MGERKRRAWDEINKIMHYDFEFIKSGNTGNDWIVFKSDLQPLDWEKLRIEGSVHPFNNPRFAQQLIIMEGSGYFDKNNREIYDCDIVKVVPDGEVDPYERICVVHITQQGYTLWINGGICVFGYSENTEIIGNTFENETLSRKK